MKWLKMIFIVSVLTALALRWQVDKLPDPSFYNSSLLSAPEQTPLEKDAFTTQAGDQHYRIQPLFNYELNGVVVSLHDADSLTDIWHHGSWSDYLNIRDLCVMWGNNIRTGIYKNIDFHNDSWTCWARWYDAETNRLFAGNQISNNHLLVDDPSIKKRLRSVRVGDQIQFSGYLATYQNPANNFKRGTSTTRDDSGNGACETVYLTDFRLIKPANTRTRLLYTLFKWSSTVSFILLVASLFRSPLRRRSQHRRAYH